MGYHANRTTSYGGRYRQIKDTTHVPSQNKYETRFKIHEALKTRLLVTVLTALKLLSLGEVSLKLY